MPDQQLPPAAVDAVLLDSATAVSVAGERPRYPDGTGAVPDPSARGTAAFRTVLRALRPLVGHGAIDAAGTAVALERLQRSEQAPNIAACRQLERIRAYPIAGATGPRVRAFLDGIQRSRVVGHLRGSPLVHGTVAAVVRERDNRQLATWREPRIRSALYAARPQLGEVLWAELAATGLDIVDICDGDDGGGPSPLPPHPMAVRARALELIALERETVERRLAAEWCRAEHDWLWIDGGISGNLAVDESACAFGVVKSHTTLYGDDEAIRTTLALRAGERSAVFLAGHRPRRAVASWYLRLRDGADGDPLHGLVRVEVAPAAALLAGSDDAPDAGVVARLGAHADDLSSWILAERAPLSRPDPRWDTLTYGVHACEAYLKAIVGQ